MKVDKFAQDYLHPRLKLFQRMLLVMMFWSTTFATKIQERGSTR